MAVRDETEKPKEFGGAFQPRNAKELANTLRGCSRDSRKVRLSGGGLTAVDSQESTLGVWMFGITGIVDIRPDDLVATAKAGTAVAEISAELRERGRRFPLRPHDFGERATVGGVFATGADGLVGRLGFRARDVLLGARAVLGSGDEVFVGANVVKSVAGFDVCKVLVGSRGCLAALTELTFRIEAVPETSTTVAATFASRVEAHAAVAIADSTPLAPSGLVVYPKGEGFRVDVLFEGPRAAVAEAAHRLARTGFAAEAGDWANLTTLATLDPPAGKRRVTGRASRAAPLDAAPDGATSLVVDVLRGRFFAHVAGRDPPPRPLDPLMERVRRAFDPKGIFEAGRGLGSS